MTTNDQSPKGAESPATGAQPQGAGEVPTGAPPSNTAPANSKEGEQGKILRAGIDSLYLSYAGQVSADVAIKLQALKEAAQSRDYFNQAAAIYSLGGHHFEVRDRGSRMFPFVLLDNAFFLTIKGPGAKQLPLCVAQVASELLLSKGIEAAVSDLEEVVTKLGELSGERAQVSRADLYVDFTSPYPLTGIDEKAWVSRAKTTDRYAQDRIVTGYTIGQGGDISARLYDKTREIVEHDKPYWKEAWIEAGWWPGPTVWRLEFQLRRRVLAEHGVNTLSDLLRLSGPLWGYCVRSWLKLTQPSETDDTPSRWPLHPVWAALSHVEWPESPSGISRPVRNERLPSDSYLFENGLSGLTSFMAREGITDYREAMPKYLEAAKEHHYHRSDFTGADLEGYLKEKAALKAREYNRRFPGIEERTGKITSDAYAREYRKRKDGE